MKFALGTTIWISIIVLLIISGCVKEPHSPLEDLCSIGEQMKQNQHVAYSYKITVHRSYAGDTSSREGIIYFETNEADTSIGFNFNQESESRSSFYNGTYLINMVHRDSFAYKKPLNDYEDRHMTRYPHLEMSYAAIQNFLTDTMFASNADSIVKSDTIIENMRCHIYSFWLDSWIVNTYKLPKQTGRKKIDLVFSERENLPVRYSQFEPISDGQYHHFEVFFDNYSFKKRYPKHQFSIENVPAYYSWDKYKAFHKVLALNSQAPDWDLPLISGNSVSLRDFRGKYLLLDFWFIGCGACVESIPILNALQVKYGEGSFEVIGVNCFSDNEQKIEAFCSERNMQYRNVWEGASICDDYLIKAAPVFYLIDKEGKVAYSQIGHDEKKLISNVEGILNQSP